MTWETRALEKGRPGPSVYIAGERPSRSMDIGVLMAALLRAREKGIATVRLDGLGTLYTEEGVLMATESQI